MMQDDADMMAVLDSDTAEGEPKSKGSMMGEICVPTSALEVGDTEHDKTAPEVGDSVEVSLGGKVSRVEGGNVYFTAKTANGEPLAEEETQEPDEREQLEKDIAASQAGTPDDYS